MPSIKFLKKEINNSIGEIIEDVYTWQLSNPDADLKKSDLIIDKAISVFDNLILKINGSLLLHEVNDTNKLMRYYRWKQILAGG